MRTLDLIPENESVTIDASQVLTVHPDIIEIIDNFEANAPQKNIKVKIIKRQKNAGSDSVKELNKVLEQPLELVP